MPKKPLYKSRTVKKNLKASCDFLTFSVYSSFIFSSKKGITSLY